MPNIGRRSLLKMVFALSAAIAATPLIAVARYLDIPYSFTPVRQLIQGASTIPNNTSLNFQWPTLTRPFDANVLVKDANGKYRAFNRVCTHLQCMVNYNSDSETIQCPCHGSVYDARTGEVVSGPAPRALPIVDLDIDAAGNVYAVNAEGTFGYGRTPS